MGERLSIPEDVRKRIIEKSKYRCGYCLAPATLIYSTLEIDHILPISKRGADEESNLWAACNWCNAHKSAEVSGIDPKTNQRVALFNPAIHIWKEHFQWADDKATILGTRRYWVSTGWYPPED